MHDDRTTTSLSEPPPAPRVAAPPIERGTHLGRYVLLERLGAGGMGVVHAAYDPDLDRKVAIKLLHPKYCEDEGRLRVLREGQAMARLSHPNVLTVYDVGSVGQQLFIATEYIDGATLGVWLAERSRTWREVLDVLVQAGRGLAAAHAAKLVHRDVKPSNILVDRAGRARVTDFGIARPSDATASIASASPSPAALPGPDTPRSAFASPLTVEGTVVGTRAYMAPEQAAGRPDARSDQYSFCLVAREALFGGRAPDPAPPWLREVIARGCEREPAARYESMDALLQRLSDDPALRRKRVLVAAGMVGIVALAAGTTYLRPSAPPPCQGVDAPWAEAWNDDLARATRRAMEATSRVHARQTFARVDQLLRERGAAWAAMKREACEATRVRGEQSERLLDLRMQCLDRLRAQTGALTALYRAPLDGEVVDRAVGAVQALAPVSTCADRATLEAAFPPPPEPERRAEVAKVERRLAEAHALARLGRVAAARSLAEAIETDAERLAWPPAHAGALVLLGTVQSWLGASTEAEKTLTQALRRAADAKDDARMAEAGLELLYVVGYDLGRPDEALQLGSAVTAMVVRAGDAPILQARLLDRLGVLRWSKGDYAAAQALFERELELLRKTAPDDPLVAAAHTNLGNALAHQGRYAEARVQYEAELAFVEATAGPDHPDAGRAQSNLGTVLMKLGELEAARRAFERALAVAEATWGPSHLMVAQASNNLGELYRETGQPEVSLRFCERALQVGQASLPADHPAHAFHRLCVGDALVALRRATEAVPHMEAAVRAREEAHGADPAELAEAQFSLARALWDARGDRRRAVALAEQARAPLETAGVARESTATAVKAWLVGKSR